MSVLLTGWCLHSTCLPALPTGGRYSAQKLVELSASCLAREKPHDWPSIVDKCERERMDCILVKEEVSLMKNTVEGCDQAIN